MSESAAEPREVLVYMTSWCGTCRMAMRWLAEAGIAYREIDIEQDAEAAQRVMSLNRGNRSVPTILVDGEHILTEPSTAELESAFGA